MRNILGKRSPVIARHFPAIPNNITKALSFYSNACLAIGFIYICCMPSLSKYKDKLHSLLLIALTVSGSLSILATIVLITVNKISWGYLCFAAGIAFITSALILLIKKTAH
jgi:hypothetical protein